jgi:hypothetical protein
VRLEVILLLRRLEGTIKLLQPVDGEQAFFGGGKVLRDDEMRLDDLGDVFLPDAARGVIRGAVLWDCCPVIRLLSIVRARDLGERVEMTSHGQLEHPSECRHKQRAERTSAAAFWTSKPASEALWNEIIVGMRRVF